MDTWLRRLRGAVGMGLAWGFAWFAAGMVLLVIVGPDAADVPFPLGFGFLGFLGGVIFSGVLGLSGAHRTLEASSFSRFAAWGGLAGFLLSVGFTVVATVTGSGELLDDLIFLAPLFAAAGAGCAAGSLALARMARGDTLLEGGE